MIETLIQYFVPFAWIVTAVLSVAMGVGAIIFSRITPTDEWKEVKKGNMAITMVMSAILLGVACAIGYTILF